MSSQRTRFTSQDGMGRNGQTRIKNLLEVFQKMRDPVFSRRKNIKSMYNRYNSSDVTRLYEKLKDPDFKNLMLRSEELMQEEHLELFEPQSTNWAEEVLYQMHYSTEVKDDDEDYADRQTEYERRKDVVKWRDAYSDYLENFSWSRLDLCWDLAWSFYVSYRNSFRQGHLKVYASILGPIPRGLDGIPYQSILTSERKLRQNRRNDRIAKATLSKDREALYDLGLDDKEIDIAFDRADHILSRG